MMVIKEWKPQKKTVLLLDRIIGILSEYGETRLTLRQLFYQLVVKGFIANKDNQYKRLSRVLTDARYAGRVPWYAIEDRTRRPSLPSEFQDIPHLIKVAVESYELDRWEGQPIRPEIWVEKDALSNILKDATADLHAAVIVNKGFGSSSSFFESAERIASRLVSGQGVKIFYLGDHDPSGLDMFRDIQKRMRLLLVSIIADTAGNEGDSKEIVKSLFTLERPALTIEQIKEWNPPPNPVKFKDTRAVKYIKAHGRECWEVDALPPTELSGLVRKLVTTCIDDVDEWEKIKKQERTDTQSLTDLMNACWEG